MQQTVILNISGLTSRWLASTPFLSVWARRGKIATIRSTLPCVERTMQATYLTGKYPSGHGIVGNGWYFRNECVIRMNPSATPLVQAPKLWEIAQRENPDFTCACLFWHLTRYATCRYWLTREGSAHPTAWGKALKRALGPCSQDINWLAKAILWVIKHDSPTLLLASFEGFAQLLERYRHSDSRVHHALMTLDRTLMGLIENLEEAGIQVILLSDHGVTEVKGEIPLNRFLREKGLLEIQNDGHREVLDPGLSRAFAVTDHQIAHIYLNDPGLRWKVWHILEGIEGIAHLLDEPEKNQNHLHHPRAGDIIAVCQGDRWFIPDFSERIRGVPPLPGFTPEQKRRLWKAPIQGSYGAIPESSLDWPLFITQADVLMDSRIEAADVSNLILQHLRTPGLTTHR